MAKAPHHTGTYQQRAARVRAAAYANPNTRCWRCGRTLEQIRRIRPRTRWDAGHIHGPTHPALAPECSWCNRADGARQVNAQRKLARTHVHIRW